ncbi:5-(carboxyamino)imidazole ribonucleotide mutase [Helicobacter sp. T3_23-1059]
MKFVSVIMGSKSDYEVMSECLKVLESFGVKYEVLISSAHRSPNRTHEYVKDAESRGAQVFIGAAGMAAHLAGAIISQTTKPVIGVPLKGGILDGLDALLSTVQMPSSMPVATMAVGKAGAINAAYLAIQILSLNDENLAQKLRQDRQEKQEKVAKDSASIEVRLS